MINKPAVDQLIGKLSADGHDASRYELCVGASKRGRQIIEQIIGRELPGKMKPITVACNEIAAGKVISAKD
mgnify:CR=1 FL=1